MNGEEDFYKNLLDNLYDGVYFLDAERRITYWNKGAERLTGYGADEVIDCYCRDDILMHVDEMGNKLCETDLCPAVKTLRDGRLREEELFLHHKRGHRVPVSIRVAPIPGPGGLVVGAVEVFSDNTSTVQTRQVIQELQKIALLDPLTQVGNRRYAELNLRARLAELERYGWPFGILFIDLDHFKEVNDRHGPRPPCATACAPLTSSAGGAGRSSWGSSLTWTPRGCARWPRSCAPCPSSPA